MDVRLSVRVGLDVRLWCVGVVGPTPNSMGMPSRIPPSCRRLDEDTALRGVGRGRLESGPAISWSASYELRRDILEGDGSGNADGGELAAVVSEKDSSGVGETGGDMANSGGRGRGPRKISVSYFWSWACCWRIECFKLDMCCRMATAGRLQ
jgi:hypothetical protein